MANVNSRKNEGPNVLILWNISFDPCLLLAGAWFCPENLPSPFPSPAGGEGIKETSPPPYGLYRILIIPIFKLCLNLLYFGPERPCFLNQGNRVAVLFTPTRRLAP